MLNAMSDNPTAVDELLDQTSTESLACVSCRSRKLKCDRIKPACSRCAKASSECTYPESRRKPTFKRRNVKELEARLAQVEGYLKEVTKTGKDDSEEQADGDVFVEADQEICNLGSFDFGSTLPSQTPNASAASGHLPVPMDMPDLFENNGGTTGMLGGELMWLGLSEALPPFEIMEDLNNIFFSTQHFYIPIVHPGSYLKAFYGSPLMKPPMCLQYAIWALAAHLHEKYTCFSEVFYQRARQYLEADEQKGVGEHFITLQHAQAYIILSSFEAKMMHFTRAAMTSAKAVRLVQMMGLDRVDGEKDTLPPTLGPPTCWAELEERRRIFWGAYSIDAHASISAGWPSLIVCDDVETKLPASEEAFNNGKEEPSVFIDDALRGAAYAGFASTIITCHLFKQIMSHAHRTKAKDHAEDLVHGRYWARHRELDNVLSGAFMFLPEKFALPRNYRDPTAIHLNLNLHASIICLHHAAIEKAVKHNHPPSLKQGSISRLRMAAEEIVNIIKLTSHQLSLFRSPLCALSMYCATTVYIFMAKEDPEEGLNSIDNANLELIIQAMEAIARKHEITRSFLQQACLDIERNGLDAVIRLPNLSKYRDAFGGAASNIPMVARSRTVASHTKISPVLPGRLPLGNPEGRIRPSTLRLATADRISEDVHISGEAMHCFQGILGAATRNNTVQPSMPSSVPSMMQSETESDVTHESEPSYKRRRTSAGESGPPPRGAEMESMDMLRSVMPGNDMASFNFLAAGNDDFATVLGETAHFDFGGSPAPSVILAHRTSSVATSTSSPMNGFGVEARSGPRTTPLEQSGKSQQIRADDVFLDHMNVGGGTQRSDMWQVMNAGL